MLQHWRVHLPAWRGMTGLKREAVQLATGARQVELDISRKSSVYSMA